MKNGISISLIHGYARTMPDDRTDPTTTGWQNVLREIRRRLNMTRRLPDEPPLHPVEEAEQAAWQTAHDAVLDRIAEMDDAIPTD